MSDSDDEIIIVDIEKELILSHIEDLHKHLSDKYKTLSLNSIKNLEKIVNNLERRARIFFMISPSS